MKPINHTTAEISSLDELMEIHLRNLSEKLARPHRLEGLELARRGRFRGGQ